MKFIRVTVNHRQMDGKIGIGGTLVVGVMPMMERGRDQKVTQEAEGEAHIGVDIDRMQADVDHVHHDHRGGEAEDEDRDQDAGARDQHFADVQA